MGLKFLKVATAVQIAKHSPAVVLESNESILTATDQDPDAETSAWKDPIGQSAWTDLLAIVGEPKLNYMYKNNMQVNWCQKGLRFIDRTSCEIVHKCDLSINMIYSIQTGKTIPPVVKNMLISSIETAVTKHQTSVHLGKPKTYGKPFNSIAESVDLSTSEDDGTYTIDIKVNEAPKVQEHGLTSAGALPALDDKKNVTTVAQELTQKYMLPTNVDVILKGPQVKLPEATSMYQPVFGTSQDSRYYMIAAGAGIKIAARYSLAGTLSVRIEGPNLKKHTGVIIDAGFDKKADSSHASVHLNVGQDPILAAKTLGAALLGLGLQLETPMPLLSVIKGK